MFISPGVIGGIFLVIGAYALSQGFAFASLFFYFVADVCWVFLAIQSNDTFGAIAIVIGITFSVITMLKMHSNQFHKNLKVKDHND